MFLQQTIVLMQRGRAQIKGGRVYPSYFLHLFTILSHLSHSLFSPSKVSRDSREISRDCFRGISFKHGAAVLFGSVCVEQGVE